jgi:Ras-related protein Rab-5C
MDCDIQVKIIILGEANVGKSCLLQRYLTGEYIESQENTVGAKFLSKKVKYYNKQVKLNIWDTAGQERYQSFSKMYCRDAKAVILVYDLANPESIEGMKRWYNIMNQETLPTDCLVFVAGSKSDIADPSEAVQDEIENFCLENRAENFLVSAKTGSGIEELFGKIVEKYCKTITAAKQSIVLSHQSQNSKKGKKSRFC